MIKDIISSAAGGRPLVLVSVVSSKGSTPRSAGAMMTVDESGLLAGTIGGGALEGRCLEEAVSFLKRLGSGGKKARPSGFLRSFSLNNSQAGDLGMILRRLHRCTLHPCPARGSRRLSGGPLLYGSRGGQLSSAASGRLRSCISKAARRRLPVLAKTVSLHCGQPLLSLHSPNRPQPNLPSGRRPCVPGSVSASGSAGISLFCH